MRALALVEGAEHVCCRYRIRAFSQALADSGWSLQIEPFAQGVFARWAQLRRASQYDSIILQRKLLPAWQLRELRRRARHLVFDFDDAVLYRDSYDPRGPHCPRRAARFALTVQLADTVIAGNDFLADCALRAGASAEQIRVIPTTIDTDRYPPSAANAGRAGVDLVWIGSSSTLQGLEQKRPLWQRIGRELPGVRLRVICDSFPAFEPLKVEPVVWSETSEAAELSRSDVGISFIPDDLWSKGKCALKVLQYQAAGLPVVANPVGVHTEVVQPKLSGFLPETDDEWVEAIRTLASSPELRARMGREARAAVEAGYSVRVWAATFVAAVAGSASSAQGPRMARARPADRARLPHERPTRRAGRGTRARRV